MRMMSQPVERRSVLRVVLFLSFEVCALAPLAALTLSWLGPVLNVWVLPFSWLVNDLSVVFAVGLAFFWFQSGLSRNAASALWFCFLAGGIALMVGFPIGTVAGGAGLAALFLMRARSSSKAVPPEEPHPASS